MKLKSLMTTYGLSQEFLATGLGVTRETIAGWESEKSSIPTKHLRDLAILLGFSIRDLTAMLSSGRTARKKPKRFGDGTPYGTVALTFVTRSPNNMDSEDRLEEFTKGATHYYPITEGERERLHVQLQRYGECPTDRWLNFTTMDNRYVFVNPVALESIQMLSDHVVEMPDYEQEETYRAISAILNGAEGTDIEKSEEESSPYSRQLIEKCRALIEDWGGVEAAAKRMSYLHAERMDGEQLSLPVDDKVMSRLGLDLAEGATKVQFIDLYPEGYYRATFFRLGALRLVEAPLHRYHDALEIDDDEVEETKPTLVSVKRVTAGGGGKA